MNCVPRRKEILPKAVLRFSQVSQLMMDQIQFSGRKAQELSLHGGSSRRTQLFSVDHIETKERERDGKEKGISSTERHL